MLVTFENYRQPAARVSLLFYILAIHAYFCKESLISSEIIQLVSEKMLGTTYWIYCGSKNIVSAVLSSSSSLKRSCVAVNIIGDSLR